MDFNSSYTPGLTGCVSAHALLSTSKFSGKNLGLLPE